MRVLSVSTAEQGASLALFDGPALVGESFWTSTKTHSKRLLDMVNQLVCVQAGMALSDLDGLIAARGPGSFTGLRIGIGVAQGIAFGSSVPAAGVSSLDGIGFRFSHASGPVCVMMDARRQEVYTAVYHFEQGKLARKSRERVCTPEAALSGVDSSGIFVGSGARVYREKILNHTRGNAVFGARDMEGVSAAVLARVAMSDPEFWKTEKNRLLPVYLRRSDAEIYHDKKGELGQP